MDNGSSDYDYLLVSDNNSYANRKTKFTFHDQDEEMKEPNIIRSVGDFTYTNFDKKNNKYYFFGPGGLISVSLDTKEVKQISEKDINHISIQNDTIYVYENIGFLDGNKYASKIYQIDSEVTLELDYPVQSFEVFNNKIYVLSAGIKESDTSAIHIYENGNLIDEKPVNEYGNLYLYQNELYVVADTYVENLSTNNKLSFVEKESKPFHLKDSYQSFINYQNSFYTIQSDDNSTTIYEAIKINETEIQFHEVYKHKEKGYFSFSYVGTNSVVLEGKDNYFINVNLETFETEKIDIGTPDSSWFQQKLILIE